MAFWDAIAVTAPKNEHAQEFLRELQTRQNEGLISKSTFLISIPDPLQDEDSFRNIGLVNQQGVRKDSGDRENSDIDEPQSPSNNVQQPPPPIVGIEKDKLAQGFAKLGSGTSTINSLFVICEKLSALSGKSYLDVDVLKDKRILLLLIGGIYQHAPLVNMCTKSFSMLPMIGVNLNYDDPSRAVDTYVGDPPVYSIDILLSNLNVIIPHLQPGFMVASTESMILFDQNDANLKDDQVWRKPGVSVITMDVDSDCYKNHGVCKIDKETNQIIEMSYKKPAEYLEKSGFIDENGKASLYTAILFFCQKSAEKLLYLYNTPPISSCTYLGIDSGTQMLKFGVYPDILCTMTKNETLDSYLNLPTFHNCNRNLVDKGRRVLWNTFRGIPINSIKIKGEFIYLKNSEDFLNLVYYNKNVKVSKRVHSYIDCKKPIEGIIMNSILTGNGSVEKTSIVYSSVLTGNWSVGSNSIVLGVKGVSFGFEILDNMIVNEIRLKSDKIKLMAMDSQSNTEPKALVVLGIHDDLNCLFDDPNATIANRSWSEFFLHSGISPDELWPKCVSKVLRTARLFPIITCDDEKLVEASLWIQSHGSPSLSVVGRWRSSKRVSIADIIGESHLLDYSQLESVAEKKKSLKLMSKQIIEGNIEAEFRWRRALSFKVDSLQVEKTLTQGEDVSILPFLHKWADSGIPIREVLDTLDRIALSSPIKYTGRLLSCISDALAIYVNHKGGLRSGPAKNSAWDKAFSYFRSHDERKGLLALAKEREKWLDSYENMIRAARHYEGAGQLVIKNIVDTCKTVLIPLCADNGDQVILPNKDWIEVKIPARIDLAGGWTDTPPICYEHGGIVINASVKVNGEFPVKVTARKVSDPKITIYFDSVESDPVICTTLLDLSDYNQPLAPGALVKCCFLQLGFIDINSTKASLEAQLKKLGGGFELISSSSLPTGSGLGTSSILAAALLFAIAHIYGYKYTDQHLIHAVLKVEQMLTAGGGWNDPAGAVEGGFKEAKCSKFSDQQQSAASNGSGSNGSITVTYDKIPVSRESTDMINRHLVLIYTGRTRLARDLLQDVIRRWYSRTTEILSVTENLLANTVDMKKALLDGDLASIGKYLSVYWKDKKCMAIGAEPTRITEIFSLINDHVYGSSLTGAGGGGFLIAVCKEDKDIFKSKMKTAIEQVDGLEDIRFYDCEVCLDGLNFKIIKSTEEQVD
ncbi:hypothetical protein CYY_007260 [Polysphondylium violaceum]|uniref:L-fucose kinase n=1 Tax=Polysphondylium violaceum TaxID=133409 RepID=A0A8J4UR00_9MYCE|nr:hypothetical protein CYY_007260 [Polysphondylium violaceum]